MPVTSSVFLNVTDIERSVAFYRGLGFKVVKSYADEDTGKTAYADLSFGGADFGLGHIASNDDASFREWVSTPLGAGVVVYFTVPNVDKTWKAAQESGATVEMPITDRPYGRMFTLNDPDGYTISFITERKPTRQKAAKKGAKRGAAAGKKAATKKAARKGAAKKGAQKKGAAKKPAGAGRR